MPGAVLREGDFVGGREVGVEAGEELRATRLADAVVDVLAEDPRLLLVHPAGEGTEGGCEGGPFLFADNQPSERI
jgi:hypothetical protein